MKVVLDLEFCKKLLAVFATHDLDSCSDDDLNNRYTQNKGYICCTRCWLLNAVRTEKCPPGATIEMYAIIEDQSAQKLDEITKIARKVRTRPKDDHE